MDARDEAEPFDPVLLTVGGVQLLIDNLRADGWTVIGPTVHEGAVTNAEITSVSDLPVGIADEQGPGHYRLRSRGDGSLFGFAAAASSPKRLFFPPRERVRGSREGRPGRPTTEPAQGSTADPPGTSESDVEESPALALFGIRSCDLCALRIQDDVLMHRAAVDVRYARRRARTFVVAVSCTAPGRTCFCTGLGTGPDPREGFDIRLTELLAPGHRFLAVAGSSRGAALLARCQARPAGEADIAAAEAALGAAAARIRKVAADGLGEALYAAAEHPHWEEIAARCLACAGCTLVCPTCFCTTIEDTIGLDGADAERWRVWDSCFTAGFSYVHTGSVRASAAARYRQWVTHKFAAWWDQFGGLGCVGCGRCTTWCPAGIDLIAEVSAIAGSGYVDTGRAAEAGSRDGVGESAGTGGPR
jgi:sulfhydrogenase subunit beta (sulfur reductase)